MTFSRTLRNWFGLVGAGIGLGLVLAFLTAGGAVAAECGGFNAEVTAVDINGQGAYATVSPGASFNVSADYKIWNDQGCPNCIDQIILGINTQGQTCLYAGSAGVYPGSQTRNTVTMTAPMNPGTYEIRWKYDLQFSCGAAIANFSNGPSWVVGYIAVGDASMAGVTGVNIAGQGTNAVVRPGATFTVNADYRIWNSSACPACIAQIVLGVDSQGQACMYNGGPFLYPGVGGAGSVTMTAPATPGTYQIRWSYALQFTCQDAVNAYHLGQNGVLGTIRVEDSAFSYFTNVDVAGQGMQATVEAGFPFTFNANYTIWNPASCPNCNDQLVLGIDNNPSACIYSGQPPLYPGTTSHTVVSMAAPSTPGVYSIRWRHDQQFFCSAALDNYPSGQNGTLACITVVAPSSADENGPAPSVFRIRDAHPNPSRGATEVRFEIPRPSQVELAVYNAGGTRVQTLRSGAFNAGTFSCQWNGCDERGHRVAAGAYWIRMQAGEHVTATKLVVLQ